MANYRKCWIAVRTEWCPAYPPYFRIISIWSKCPLGVHKLTHYVHVVFCDAVWPPYNKQSSFQAAIEWELASQTYYIVRWFFRQVLSSCDQPFRPLQRLTLADLKEKTPVDSRTRSAIYQPKKSSVMHRTCLLTQTTHLFLPISFLSSGVDISDIYTPTVDVIEPRVCRLRRGGFRMYR